MHDSVYSASQVVNKASVERGLFAIRNRHGKPLSVRHRVSTSAIEEVFTRPRDDFKWHPRAHKVSF